MPFNLRTILCVKQAFFQRHSIEWFNLDYHVVQYPETILTPR